ncbi:hypothetical protein KHA80_00965 [Anaerobacillus sp. HL2]|nr:hypothetical protein KHA80_00965 [Anaerobacillus sp. HL2]
MLGLKWVRLEGIKPSSFKGYRDHFVNGVSLLLFPDGYQLITYGKNVLVVIL